MLMILYLWLVIRGGEKGERGGVDGLIADMWICDIAPPFTLPTARNFSVDGVTKADEFEQNVSML